ncbi:MAG: hypothetical protein CL433_13270, partial [Acidimicrobiaceae bacterium]|nr:hypothetical protein [Acidimicrobiaceae bacterium]
TDWLDAARAESEARGPDRAPTEAASGLDLAGVQIVVVSGLPRSGTSMLMQMLTAGGLEAFVDGEREADASNPRGYYEHDRVRALARDKTWVPEADGRVVKVVAPLLPHLPIGAAYRVVLLTRDIGEVLASQRRMLDRLGRPSVSDDVLAPAYSRHLLRAQRWIDRAPGVQGLTLDHATVLADPTGAAEALAAFLGADLDTEAMAAVVDPSLHRERS